MEGDQTPARRERIRTSIEEKCPLPLCPFWLMGCSDVQEHTGSIAPGSKSVACLRVKSVSLFLLICTTVFAQPESTGIAKAAGQCKTLAASYKLSESLPFTSDANASVAPFCRLVLLNAHRDWNPLGWIVGKLSKWPLPSWVLTQLQYGALGNWILSP